MWLKWTERTLWWHLFIFFINLEKKIKNFFPLNRIKLVFHHNMNIFNWNIYASKTMNETKLSYMIYGISESNSRHVHFFWAKIFSLIIEYEKRVGVRNDLIFWKVFQFYKEFYNRFEWIKIRKCEELCTPPNAIK